MEMTDVVSIKTDSFGKTKEGRPVARYTFTNKNKVTVRIINFGCVITEILVPDKNGKIDDICLGHDAMEGYEDRSPHFGGIIGRCASRINNGKFKLDGKKYNLTLNNKPHHMNGGFRGFTFVSWKSRVEDDKLILEYTSPDGEEGYPGEVKTTVTYQLTNDNELIMNYTATSNKATPLNLSNHAYFNLNNQAARDITDHLFTIFADNYVSLDNNQIPTGSIEPVAGTFRDLRTPKLLESRLYKDKGFSVHYSLGECIGARKVARVEHPLTGRYLEVFTTELGLQCYFSHEKVHDEIKGKGGVIYGRFSAFCLGAMHFPDSCNHDNFPNVILRPGDTYRQKTIYKFGIMDKTL